MNPNQGREAAYVSSRIKDLSLITNTPDFVGLFACITPKAHPSLESVENKIDTDGDGELDTYLPQLIRDVDTLDMLFGDPRIDPATYKDLYTIRYIVQSGFACYVAKVRSGNPYMAYADTNSDEAGKGLFNSEGVSVNTQFSSLSQNLQNVLRSLLMFKMNSSVTGTNSVDISLIPIKPYSLNQVALDIVFKTQASDTSDPVQIASARVMLVPDIKNSDLLTVINAYLGGELTLSLPDNLDDSSFATVDEADEYISSGYFCLSNILLYICGLYNLKEENGAIVREKFLLDNMKLCEIDGKTGLSALAWPYTYSAESTKGTTFHAYTELVEDSLLTVSQGDYITSLNLYKDPKFAGCFISELTADVTHEEERSRTVYDKTYTPHTGVLEPDKTYYVNVATPSKPNYAERVDTGENKNDERIAYERSGAGTEQDPYIYSPTADDPLDPEKTYYVDLADGAVGEIVESEYVERTKDNMYRPVYEEKYVVYTGAIDPSGTYYVLIEGNYVLRDDSNATYTVHILGEITSDERRGLHYIVKQVASLRKDLTCVFSTPYSPYDDGYGTGKKPTIFDLDRACNWVAAKGDYSDLFEYGNSQALDYSEQAFYCEMYWSWLKWNVVSLINGLAIGTTSITVAPAAFVILRGLASYRARGTFYPVAGDQGGVLPDSCVILQNPSTKTQRDKLISYRINPIYDTGLRGIQIYGNDTLNPQYTDLSAAHIGRTMVFIRSRVDAYTETIKFSLNTPITWGSWINYVSTRILDPIRSLNGLQWYQVDMGYNTTSRDEIAQRKIRGRVSLQFTQALEIIDLEFVVNSSALVMEE